MDDVLDMFLRTWSALPAAAAGAIVLVVGLALSSFLKLILTRFLKVVRFDRLGERTGVAEFLRKGGARHSASGLVGILVYWVAVFITFLEALKIIDPGIHTAFTERMAASLPSLAAAILIIVAGSIVTSFVANFIQTIALNASIPHARLLSRATRWLGITIVATLAVEQAGLGRSIVESLFQMLFGAVAFGTAIAFGLGCKDFAREAMGRLISNLREKERVGKGGDLEG